MIHVYADLERNIRSVAEGESDLVSAGLSKSTIRKHLSNVDFYINTYLLREEALDMEQGCIKIGMFLGYYFIHKYM